MLHTVKGVPQYAVEGDGDLMTRNKPQRLRLVGVHAVNGLSFNLIPASASSVEAAGWLLSAPSATNRKDNPYRTAAAEKHCGSASSWCAS